MDLLGADTGISRGLSVSSDVQGVEGEAVSERRTIGDLARDHFELRYAEDGDLDEIVVHGAKVHLERMDGRTYCLIITMPSGEAIHSFLHAPRRRARKALPAHSRRLTINLIESPKAKV